MRYRLLLFIFLICPLLSSGQNIALIDSLKYELLLSKDSFKQMNLLNDIGFAYRLSYPDSTIYYCKKAYAMGLEIGAKDELAKILSFIGLAYGYKGEYAESFDYHMLAVDNAIANYDSLQLAYAYNNLGRLFFDQGDLVRAYNYLADALQLMEKSDDKLGLSYVYRSLSNLYKSQNNIEKSLEASQQALSYRMQHGDTRAILSAMFELGLVYQKAERPGRAIAILNKADSLAVSINDQISQSELLLAIAQIHIDQGEFVKAMDKTQLAYGHIQKSGNERLLPTAWLLLARVNIAMANYGEARQLLLKLEKEAERINNPSLQRDAYYYLSEVARYEGDKNNEIGFQNKYLILKEKLQNIDLVREIEGLEFQIQIERKERENEVLKANQKVINAQLELEKQVKITLLIILVLAIILLIVVWRNSNKKRLANKRLSEQRDHIEQQRREIEKQNELISDQNNKLLLRNETLSDLNNEKDTLMNIVVHDLKSPFTRVDGLLEVIRMSGGLNEAQKQAFDMIKTVTKGGVELIRDILDVNELESERTVLHPEYIALNEFVQEKMLDYKTVAELKRIKLDFKNSPICTILTDPSLLARVLENLISNAVKFSSYDTKVTVWLEKDKDQVKINIKDEGPGFSTEDKEGLFQKFKKLSARPTGGESSNGLGLAIVKILLERLDGEIMLNSDVEKGSHFIIRLKSN